jgi:hypothetical protein
MNIPGILPGQDENLYQSELNQNMQGALSNNGWTVPNQTTANITTIAPSMPNGTMWYDETSHQLKYIKNGVVTPI